jgi:dsDNA-specific endonuclease/ATPase MutS2
VERLRLKHELGFDISEEALDGVKEQADEIERLQKELRYSRKHWEEHAEFLRQEVGRLEKALSESPSGDTVT